MNPSDPNLSPDTDSASPGVPSGPRSHFFREKLKTFPDNPLFRFSLGQALLEENQSREACQHLEWCVGTRSDWMAPRLLLGRACMLNGEYTQARRWLEEALQLARQQNHMGPQQEIMKMLEELT